MATNWSAYDAAKEIYGTNKENIQDIGSRFPLFMRTVSMANSEYLLDILKALPKVTARVVESGLKEMEEADDLEEEVKEEKKETKKAAGKKAAKTKQADEEEEVEEAADGDYESMTAKDLYKLCCERGISSQCKKRDKKSLIAVLKANEGSANVDDDDDWDEDEEEEKDPYKDKTARELYDLCVERGIKTKPKQKADAYVKLLKKADEAAAEEEEAEDDDDDWEI